MLLVITPMDDASTQNAEGHKDFLKFVLSVFNKGTDIFVYLVGDNTYTNLACSRNFYNLFIGGHNHRPNFSVNDFFL